MAEEHYLTRRELREMERRGERVPPVTTSVPVPSRAVADDVAPRVADTPRAVAAPTVEVPAAETPAVETPRPAEVAPVAAPVSPGLAALVADTSAQTAAFSALSTPEPATQSAPDEKPVRFLTRRELRLRQQAGEAAIQETLAELQAESIAVPAHITGPILAPENDPLPGTHPAHEPGSPEEVQAGPAAAGGPEPEFAPVFALTPETESALAQNPEQGGESTTASENEPQAPLAFAPRPAMAPVQTEPESASPGDEAAHTSWPDERVPTAPQPQFEPAPQPQPASADTDDDDYRHKGSGAAGPVLILPTFPGTADVLSSPLDETGEMLLTGTIELPSAIGSTGVVPNGFTETDDDQSDTGYAISSENHPVAVSHVFAEETAGRVLPTTRSSHRTTIVLSIVAGVLVAAAAGILVYYFFLQG